MGTSMLGGSRATAAPVIALLCSDALACFESEEIDERARAVALCGDCPLLTACRSDVRREILLGEPPLEIVRAGVAWTEHGTPDPQVHGTDFAPGWLPALETTSPSDKDPDVDLVAVALVFTEPARVRDTLTASEIDGVYREAAHRKESLNFLRKALKLHPREVHRQAVRLGIRDRFATKPTKTKRVVAIAPVPEPVTVEVAGQLALVEVIPSQRSRAPEPTAAEPIPRTTAAVAAEQLSLLDIFSPDVTVSSAPVSAVSGPRSVALSPRLIHPARGSLFRRALVGRLRQTRLVALAGPSLQLLTAFTRSTDTFGIGSRNMLVDSVTGLEARSPVRAMRPRSHGMRPHPSHQARRTREPVGTAHAGRECVSASAEP